MPTLAPVRWLPLLLVSVAAACTGAVGTDPPAPGDSIEAGPGGGGDAGSPGIDGAPGGDTRGASDAPGTTDARVDGGADSKPSDDAAVPHAPIELTGQVWYVRHDGGDAMQCDGKADAAYPGTGTAQHCAFKNPHYLWGDDVAGETAKWKIAGGDSVVIRGEPYRMGYKGPNSGDGWGQCGGDPYGCSMPPIPPGSAGKTTKLLGEGYASCTKKTQLFGGYALGTVLNLKDTHDVTVACLELTDHAQCSRTGAVGPHCNSSYPLDDYAGNGIATNLGTVDVELFDLDLHGFTSRGIIGSLGGAFHVDNVRIAFNGEAGWDFDDGKASKPGAVVDAKRLEIAWSGCNEQYPIVDANPAVSCFDQDSGGYGDGVGTPDTTLDFQCDHCSIHHNTQDGLDLAHTSGSRIVVTHSASWANMGQQWKFGAMETVRFQNNTTVHDCHRMSAPIAGAPASYNANLSLFCRAAGDGIALSMKPTGTYTFQYNSFVGYGSTSFDLNCSAADCTGAKLIFQDNLNLGYVNTTDGKLPGLFYYGAGVNDSIWVRDHNVFFGFRSTPCPSAYPNESCDSPQFVAQPTWKDESSLDDFDFHIADGSPARDHGSAVGSVTDDHFGGVRPQGPAFDIGAHER